MQQTFGAKLSLRPLRLKKIINEEKIHLKYVKITATLLVEPIRHIEISLPATIFRKHKDSVDKEIVVERAFTNKSKSMSRSCGFVN